MSPEKRRSMRAQLEIDAGFRKRGNLKSTVLLIDLSRHGFRAHWHNRATVGDEVWLTLPGLQPLPANVVRADNHDLACDFQTPLHEAVFDRLIANA